VKIFRVTWKIRDSTISTQVIAVTDREERMVELAALLNLKRDGVSVDRTRISSPTVELIREESALSDPV
jgi:hypothetical protein